jgi:hypothetical protein
LNRYSIWLLASRADGYGFVRRPHRWIFYLEMDDMSQRHAAMAHISNNFIFLKRIFIGCSQENRDLEVISGTMTIAEGRRSRVTVKPDSSIKCANIRGD